MGPNSNQPMYFSYLELENVKCFSGKQVLDLKNTDGTISPWTLILGNNGLGKTTLLKCLAWMTAVEETDETKKKEANIPEGMIALKPALDELYDDSEYEHLARIGSEVTTVVSAQLTIGCPLKQLPRPEQIIKYSIEIKTEKGELQDIKPSLFPVKEFSTPVIYAYSAGRHMELKNIDRSELFDPVSNLFSESGELLDATEQLLNQDHAALQENPKGKETALLEKIKSILVDLLPGVIGIESITVHAKEREVKIQTKDGAIPLNDLSLGYKTMVAWTVDLALKMLAQNPEHEKPLEAPAVVIIDEVDLHLHPQWQRSIQQKLTHHFTNTQFICTAHSPFMAQSAENENLCVVNRKNGEVKIDNAPLIVKGWRIGQIATSDLFGLTSERGPDEEHDIERRRQLIDKESRTDEEQTELIMLNQRISNLPGENSMNDTLLNQLDKATQVLRERGLIND